MTNYRCYFLGPSTPSPFGAPSLIEAAQDLQAGTDEEARLTAEAAYARRRNHLHGFELWQGTRLVHRQASIGNGRAKSGLRGAQWPIDRAGLAALTDVGLTSSEIGAYFSISLDDVQMLREDHGLAGGAHLAALRICLCGV